MRTKRGAVVLLSLGLSFCSHDPQTSGEEISLALIPSSVSVFAGDSLKFTVTVLNSKDKRVTWSLSGAGCTGPLCGMIDNDGVYMAPVTAPSPATVTVKATAVADTSKSAAATVTVLEAVNEWTWMSGSEAVWHAGVYGTKGTPDPTNVPGAREMAVSWIDAAGKFWLFGGLGRDSAGDHGKLNDLWRYDPATAEWTWMSGSDVIAQAGVYGTKGTPDPANVPGAREGSVSWAAADSRLWLFGGLGWDSAGDHGKLNDLWRYDPATAEWAWMSGSDVIAQAGVYGTKGTPDPANVPGARNMAVSSVDADGNFWLFGGEGYDSLFGNIGALNDLWRYDPLSQLWTWLSGRQWTYQAGVYGTMGLSDPRNVPGARERAVSWVDAGGDFWVFGGMGLDSVDNIGDLNDLWRFSTATREWTWISGSPLFYEAGVYGIKGRPAPSNIPGARSGARGWADPQGKLWLFGGWGLATAHDSGYLNDLWKFDPVNTRWTWVSGTDTTYAEGAYGTIGVPSSLTTPGARSFPTCAVALDGRAWLFGGYGRDSGAGLSALNDLWMFRR